jgi:hypothetical protein
MTWHEPLPETPLADARDALAALNASGIMSSTNRMFGRCTASQIASASAASVLLLFT